MNKSYKYKLMLLAVGAAALFAGCSQDRPEGIMSDEIRITATGSDVATKGFINKTDLESANGAQVQVYDFLTGFQGTITPAPAAPESYANGFTYINDVITNDGNNKWSFSNNVAWRWTRTGDHKFYGWLTNDGAGLTPASLVSGVAYDASAKVLSVPSVAFTKETAQFDFSYSDIVNVDVTASSFNSSASVELPMKHLFSALAIEFLNTTTDDAFIKKIELKNFKSTKSAAISFAGNATDVTYTSANTQPDFTFTWPSESTVDSNYGHKVPSGTNTNPTRYDIIGGEALAEADDPNFFMIWPQMEEEFNSATAPATIDIEYYIDGVMDEDDDTKLAKKEKSISIPATALLHSMDAGVKYILSLQFREKTLTLTLKPMPWIMDYMDVDYATSSILANATKENEGVLWLFKQEDGIWKAGNRNRQITMTNGEPIQGRFYILAPTRGQWQISTHPAEAAKYFVIKQKVGEDQYEESNSGIIEDLIDVHNVFTGYVEFYVFPNPEYPELPSTQELNFNVDFLINGEWRNGNTEFNRKNWTLIREPGN